MGGLMTTGVGLDSIGSEDFDFTKASFIDRPIEERSERERKEAVNSKKWPRIWNEKKHAKFEIVTKEMAQEAWNTKLNIQHESDMTKEENEAENEALGYSGRLGELVLLNNFGRELIRYVGKSHNDFESLDGKISVEAKTTASEQIYHPNTMLFLIVRRKLDQQFDFIVYMHAPKKDLVGHKAILCGYHTYEQYMDERIKVNKGSKNGRIEHLQLDNWGISYPSMRPIDELKYILSQHGGKQKQKDGMIIW